MSSRNNKKRREKKKGKKKGQKKERTSCVSLGIHDYRSILDYYNLPHHHMKRKTTLKKNAQDVLRSKLCSCIKKVQKQRTRKKQRTLDESAAIAICNASVVKRKQIRLKSFQCAKKNIKLCK